MWGLLRSGSIETFAARFPVNRFICPIHWRPMCGLVNPKLTPTAQGCRVGRAFYYFQLRQFSKPSKEVSPQHAPLHLVQSMSVKFCTRSTTARSLSKMGAKALFPPRLIYAGCRFWFSIYLQAAWTTNKMSMEREVLTRKKIKLNLNHFFPCRNGTTVILLPSKLPSKHRDANGPKRSKPSYPRKNRKIPHTSFSVSVI